MTDLIEKCHVCRALVDEEDLFCANCGTEAEHDSRPITAMATETTTHDFDCQGCGASMSYDATAGTLRCPFCGSDNLDSRGEGKSLAPSRGVPFAVGREQAEAAMRRWLGNGFWRPGDLASSSAIRSMTPVYVPYWVFEATTFTYWTADSSQTPMTARGDWVPVTGRHHGRYEGLLIGASSVLSPHETGQICPFDLAHAVPLDRVPRENYVVEQFRVPRKYARPLARAGLENLEREACERYVPGRCRNMKVNVRLENLSSEPVIVPVWIMAYVYKDRVYRFLINGQTGRATGEAPFSWMKLTIVGAIVLAVLLLFFVIAMVVQAM